MYVIKEKYMNTKDAKNFNKLIKEYNIKQKEIAKKTGIGIGYISQLANGEPVSKMCAYSVCKAISADLEVLDLFVGK